MLFSSDKSWLISIRINNNGLERHQKDGVWGQETKSNQNKYFFSLKNKISFSYEKLVNDWRESLKTNVRENSETDCTDTGNEVTVR